jgi:NAD(P)-dependent dehydrogenase (short-subunit alcohol dehydrogenase family)
MTRPPYRTALIVGAGPGIGASVARALAAEGLRVGLAARDPAKLRPLAEEVGASAFVVDASDPDQVERLFEEAESKIGEPDVVVYNASTRAQGALTEISPDAVWRSLQVSAYGGFLVAQQAAKRMLPRAHGAILFTGATASVKGFARSAGFAMGKFALRGLAQSVARELAPKGIHVVHFVIDGGVRAAHRPDPAERPDSTIDPDAIAQSYVGVLRQPRSAWSWEIEVRPWVETF